MTRQLLIGLVLGLCCVGSIQAAQERPNILLLVAEDMSSHVGVFGDDVAVTPNLDQLAGEGVRFTDVFATAGVCAPSRSSLLTGVHQMAIGTQHMRTSSRPEGAYKAVPPAHIKAFPELLRAAGYYTYTDNKLDYQFSDALSGTGPFTIWNAEGWRTNEWHGRDAGQPFFGMVNFMVTHESGVFPSLGNWPHSVTQWVMQLFHFAGDYDVGVGPVTPEQVAVPPYYPDTTTVREDIARHYNNIYQMDRQVGRIIDRLKADGLYDNTIIVWTTDHGDGLPRAKRSLHDSGIRVPLMVRWPERYRPAHYKPGMVEDSLVSFIDMAPTIMAMGELQALEHMTGQDFLAPEYGRRYIFAAQDRIDNTLDRQRAVRDRRYKYIRSWYPQQPLLYPSYFRDNQPMMRELLALHEAGQLNSVQRLAFEAPGREQLYDVQADPFELVNLIGQVGMAPVLKRLSQKLDSWLAATGDMSELEESLMVSSFMEHGSQRTTTAPQLAYVEGKLVLSSSTLGASLAYKIGSGLWRIYTEPFGIKPGQEVQVKAVRYGWKESVVVSYVGS